MLAAKVEFELSRSEQNIFLILSAVCAVGFCAVVFCAVGLLMGSRLNLRLCAAMEKLGRNRHAKVGIGQKNWGLGAGQDALRQVTGKFVATCSGRTASRIGRGTFAGSSGYSLVDTRDIKR